MGGYTMNNYDLRHYYNIFKVVIDMADERYKEYKAEFDKADTDGDGIVEYTLSDIGNIDDLAMKGKEKELFDYLNSLDYEVIKALQVIMYIGRDSSCMEDDGTYSYERTRKSFDSTGWNDDKSIEVDQMVQKIHLNEYLRNGLKKLEIVL